MRDIHSVFHRDKGGKLSPLTMQPTPQHRVTKPTQFIPTGPLAEWQKQAFDTRNREHGLESPVMRDIYYRRAKLAELAGAGQTTPAEAPVAITGVPPGMESLMRIPKQGGRAGQVVFTGPQKANKWLDSKSGFPHQLKTASEAMVDMQPEEAKPFYNSLLQAWMDKGISLDDLTGHNGRGGLDMSGEPGWEEAVAELKKSEPMDLAMQLLKMPWYYHGTPEENLESIQREGIHPSADGRVHAMTDRAEDHPDGGGGGADMATDWAGNLRRREKRIATIPFWRDEGDPLEFNPGALHREMHGTIPPEDLPQPLPPGQLGPTAPQITIQDNPNYDNSPLNPMQLAALAAKEAALAAQEDTIEQGEPMDIAMQLLKAMAGRKREVAFGPGKRSVFKVPKLDVDLGEAMDPVELGLGQSLENMGLPFLGEKPVRGRELAVGGRESEYKPFVTEQTATTPLAGLWGMESGQKGAALPAAGFTSNRLAQEHGLHEKPWWDEFTEMGKHFGRQQYSRNPHAAALRIKDLQPTNVGVHTDKGGDESLRVFDPVLRDPTTRGSTLSNINQWMGKQPSGPPIHFKDKERETPNQYQRNMEISNLLSAIANIGRIKEQAPHTSYSTHLEPGHSVYRDIHENLPSTSQFDVFSESAETPEQTKQAEQMTQDYSDFKNRFGTDLSALGGYIQQPLDQQKRLWEFEGEELST